MWERWDAIKPDGRIHGGEIAGFSGGMLSFNHYAFGAVAGWLPAWRASRIDPAEVLRES